MAYNPLLKRELIIFFYKNYPLLLRVFVITFGFFIVVSFIPTPRYHAQSALIVRLGSEYVYQPEVGTSDSGPSVALPFNQDQIFKAEVAILASDSLHKQVVNDMTRGVLFPQDEYPNFFRRCTRAMRAGFMYLLESIGLAAAPTPEEVERVRNAVAVEKFNKHLDIALEKESAVIRVSYDHPDPMVAARALDHLLACYLAKRHELYRLGHEQALQEEVERRHQQAINATQALQDYKHTHMLYSIDDQRAQILSHRDEALERASVIRDAGLQHKIDEYNLALDQLDAQEKELTGYEREAKLTEESYMLAAHKLEDAKALDALESKREDSVRIIEPASVAAEPVRLQGIIILLGFFAALFVTLCTAGVLDFLCRGFLTQEQVEETLGLKVLSTFAYRQ